MSWFVTAQAAVPQLQQLSEDNSLYLLILAAALPSLASLVLNFVQWLGKRTVDREDKDKEEVRERLARSERANDDLRAQYERRFSETERSLIEIRTEMKTTVSVIESVRSVVQELRATIDNRFEKQSDFYRLQLKELMGSFAEKLEKLEQDLRHDMSRAIADHIPQRRVK